MNYSRLFYWVSVADNARAFFITFTAIFTLIAVIATCVYIVAKMSEEIDAPSTASGAKKWVFWSYPFMVLFWIGVVFCPTKKQSLLIIAGGQTLNYLTSNETAKQIPNEVMNYVVSELKNLAKEADISLDIKSEKDRILEQVKTLSTEELIKKLKDDPNLAKLLLEN